MGAGSAKTTGKEGKRREKHERKTGGETHLCPNSHLFFFHWCKVHKFEKENRPREKNDGVPQTNNNKKKKSVQNAQHCCSISCGNF